MSAIRAELGAQMRLAIPVVMVNLSLMTMNVVDSAVMGHVSTTGFAAVRQGHALLWVPLAFCMGMLLALDPLVAQALGAKDEPAVGRAVQRGLVTALLLCIPMGLAMIWAEPALIALQQPAEIIPDATDYAQTCAWGVPGMLLFVALRRSLQALGRMRPLVVVVVIANIVNAALDWALIRGEFGFPALGAHGCALATVVCNYLMLVLVLVLTWRDLKPLLYPLRPRALALGPLLRLAVMGLPIGLAMALEVGAFNAITFIMGKFGTLAVAANAIVITLASTSFMLPLGLSTAAAVRVGHAVGAGDPVAMRLAAKVALGCGAGVMGCFGLLFVILPEPLLKIFSTDPEVLALALTFVPLAAGFQLFDGLQVVAAGVLRGIGETRVPMLANLVGYWVLALPLGLVWAFSWGGGPQAMWWALGAGLGFVALILVWRVRRRLARDVARIDIEGQAQPSGP